MNIAESLSKKLDMPWKRVMFLVEVILALCLLIALSASSYLYYSIYFSDSFIIHLCHKRAAQTELNVALDAGATSPEMQKVWPLVNKRLGNRWSMDIRKIEHSAPFRACLAQSWLQSHLLNLQWALREARNFAFWLIALPLLAFLLGRLLAVGRWAMMR